MLWPASHAYAMIAGNPKAGRRVATLAVALFVALLLASIVISFRKKTAPQQEPPMVSPTLVTRTFVPSWYGRHRGREYAQRELVEIFQS